MISIIHRSLLASFVRNLGYTIIGSLILFTLVDVFENIGSFVDNDAANEFVDHPIHAPQHG